MSRFVLTERHGGVAVLRIDNPPVNALSPGVPEALIEAVEAAERDPRVSAIVIAGAGRTFVAGVDITTLEHAAWGDRTAAPDLHGLLGRLEDARLPIVMAIHGTALGGGLELAMAGHYRVAAHDALLGQPEVNLGIIPGAEGTQRLPRLVGVERALDLCVTGKPVKATEAHAVALVDAVIESGEFIGGAVAFAERIVGHERRRTRDLCDKLGTPEENAPRFAAARQLASKIRRHQVAPQRVVEAIEAATTSSFEDGCRREREIFLECVEGEQAKAMVHLFFAERAVAKVAGITPDLPVRPIHAVGIVGAGTMGTGIAMACAHAGITVRITDAAQPALDAGLERIRQNYDVSVSRGRFTADDVRSKLTRIQPQLGYEGFDEVDLVIEAVFEDLALKSRILADLDAVLAPGAIIATNTSTLSIDTLASATNRPENVIGLHFFSPANVMRLLEIVRGRDTSAATIATALAFAKRLGKVGVLVGNGPAFVGNRLMLPYMYETQFLVEEGSAPEEVDKALTGFGMAMGMFAVDDMAGLDVASRVRQALGFYPLRGSRTPLIQDVLCAHGRLGQKAGRGWYRYDGGRAPIPDPDVVALVRETAAAHGIRQRTFTEHDIVERAIYSLVNEGARVLDEGVAERASDIDVIYANGYGFPAWRGGPMFHADRVGLDVVLSRIRAFEATYGERWAPAPLLVRLAAEGGTFRAFDRARRDRTRHG